MAKKKKINREEIISLYMNYVLENNMQPNSVYSFAKKNNFEESEFYMFFGNFNALEQDIFATFFENTIKVLDKSEEYKNFDSRNKLLSFYFTFFENLTANRSFVNFMLNRNKEKVNSLKSLSQLRQKFANYIDELDISTVDLNQETLQKIQDKTIQETAWLQLVITMKFWLDDNSSSFEKTDIFIEKSVNASFDIINISPFHSLVDLGKFLFKEKIHMN